MQPEDRIKKKIASLLRLAERPGTPEEGELALRTADELAQKYGITYRFLGKVKHPVSTRPTASAPQPKPVQQTADAIFYQWIKALANIGWIIYETEDTKIGKQIRFRKPGFNSEIRVTQRAHSDGRDFEAEHIMRPDDVVDGRDRSFCSYMTISLPELMRHLDYTTDNYQCKTRKEYEFAHA